MIFVDTNYFLRFILKDVPDQFKTSFKLFDDASLGKKQLSTDTLVIFEIYWVLKNLYTAEHPFVKDSLLKICSFDFIYLAERSLLFEAISNFDSFSFDLEDSYHFFQAKLQKVSKLATFDSKLMKKFELMKNEK